jgi:alpha-tubulin suppressor-like RCC1 family protein
MVRKLSLIYPLGLMLLLSLVACKVVDNEIKGHFGSQDEIPPDPILTRALALSASEIELSWITGGGLTSSYLLSYQVGTIAPSDCDSTAPFGGIPISEPTYFAEDLIPGTVYSFRICATNSSIFPKSSPGLTVTVATEPSSVGTLNPSMYIIAPGALASYSSTADVVLLASSAFTEMYITNSPGCGTGGTWEPYATVKSGWPLAPDGLGYANVSAKFRNQAGTESACVNDSIEVPEQVVLNACSGSTTNYAAGTMYDDGGPSSNYSVNKNCDFTINYMGPMVLHFNSFSLENNYDFVKVWTRSKTIINELGKYSGTSIPGDLAINRGPTIINFYSDISNVNSGFELTWSPVPGTSPESSIFTINAGSEYTISPNVNLGIGVSDPNLSQMYITNNAGCSSGGIWETTLNTRPWTLTASDGRQSVYIKFRDSSLHETPCEYASTLLYLSSPVAVLTGTPLAPDTGFSVDVGGTLIQYYQYKFGPNLTTDCTSSLGYSATRNAGTKIADNFIDTANGDMKLCVIGAYELDLFQSYASATVFQWTKQTPATLSFSDSGKTLTEGDQNITFTVVADQLTPLPVLIKYDVFGSLVSELSLTGGTVLLPANASSVDIVIPVLNNPSSAVDRILTVGISEVSDPQAIGFQSQSSAIFQDAQRAVTHTVLDISEDGKCVIIAPGILKCSGEIGGTTSTTRVVSDEYIAVSASSNFTKVVYSQSHRCALNANAELYCWGWGFDGNLGQGNQNDQSAPVIVPGYTWKLVNAKNWNVVCGISSDDDLYCWGDQTFSNGAVGNGTTSDSRSPFQIDAGTKYQYVDTTGYLSCAISMAGQLKCWGKTPVGDGSSTDQYAPVDVDVGNTYSHVRIRGGSCGITTSGSLKCWGKQYWANISNTLSAPELIPGPNQFKDIAYISNFACALTIGNEVFCFGYDPSNFYGQGIYTSTPFPIDPGVQYQSISTAETGRICGLLLDGTVKCWGLGSYSTSSKNSWPKIADPYDKYVSLRGACGVTQAGRAKCLGSLANVQHEYSYPVDNFKNLGTSVKWKQVSEYCGLDTQDKLRCWYTSEFKNSKYSSSRGTPSLIASDTSFKKISSYGKFVCGIRMDDTLVCLGTDSYGRIGNGTNSAFSSTVPVPVDASETYLDVSVTSKSVCGVTISNKLKCWGTFDTGNLGTGDTANHFSPTWIDVTETYLSVKNASTYACGMTSLNAIKCWGNSMGSGGTFSAVLQPVVVSAVTDTFTKIGVSSSFACGIRSADQRLMCWGSNSNYKLGTGNTTHSHIPVLSADTETYAELNTGSTSGCGITTSDVTKCWGYMSGYGYWYTPTVFPSTVNKYMFERPAGGWTGIAADGSITWLYKATALPGVPSSGLYFEHIQGIVDR